MTKDGDKYVVCGSVHKKERVDGALQYLATDFDNGENHDDFVGQEY